jgi:hypothetical protein
MINLENPKISIFIGQEGTTIELHDSKSSTRFATIKLTNDQLASALSRVSHTDCSIELVGLDKVNKKMQCQHYVFEINEEMRGIRGALNQKCLKSLQDDNMTDWIPDGYFGSKNSFFKKDGKYYARAVIRKWS